MVGGWIELYWRVPLFKSHYPFFCLHIQGEIGVGVPGLRGERGDPGPRVMSMTNLTYVHLLVCVSDCDGGCICLIILGRRRSGWNRWRERPYCKYTPPFCSQHSAFAHYFFIPPPPVFCTYWCQLDRNSQSLLMGVIDLSPHLDVERLMQG